MVIPHALAAVGAIDLAHVAGEIATCGGQRRLFHLDIDLGRLAGEVLLVGRHQLETGQPLALGCPAQLPGGAAVFSHLLAIDEQLDLGDVVIGVGHIASHGEGAAQGHLGTGGGAGDAHLGRLWRHHGGNLEAGIRLTQHLAIFIQRPGLEGVIAHAGGRPAGTPGGGRGRGDLGAIDQVLHLGQRRDRAAQGHRQGQAGTFADAAAHGGGADGNDQSRRRHLTAMKFPGIGPDGADTGLVVVGGSPAPAGIGEFFAFVEGACVADDIAGLVGGASLIGGIGGVRPGGHGRKGNQHGEPAGPEGLLHLVIILVLSWLQNREKRNRNRGAGNDNRPWTGPHTLMSPRGNPAVWPAWDRSEALRPGITAGLPLTWVP
ncbi:hypothetical protein D3C86_975820 [compost metagenome]